MSLILSCNNSLGTSVIDVNLLAGQYSRFPGECSNSQGFESMERVYSSQRASYVSSNVLNMNFSNGSET
jgi:hypothetical protein